MKIRSLAPASAALLVLGAAGWILPHVLAQPMWDMVTVTLPYTVAVGDKTLAPGDYIIKQMESADDSPVLMIYNDHGMKFQTMAMTVKTLDPNTPQDTSVTLHHIGDNYYIDKVWIEGKNYGYQIPLPKNVKERATEAAAVSVPAKTGSSAATTASTTDTASTSSADTPPPPPAPPAEPVASTPPPQPTPAPEPQASTDTQQPTPTPAPASSDDNSANREKQPEMPSTSAGWLAILLMGGTLSGTGMMLRRRKQ